MARLHWVETVAEGTVVYRVYDFDTDEVLLTTADYDEAMDYVGMPLGLRRYADDPGFTEE